MLTNPFITFGYESAEYFCDRESETAFILQQLSNGNHLALISPRRMGKTSLIQHCFAQPLLHDEYYTFLVDIYYTKTLSDFVYQMGRAIVNRLKSCGQRAIDRFLQVVTSLRTGISFDGQGNASWNLQIGDIKSADFTLDEIFRYLGSADKACIVAIDEFQSISNYPEANVEAILRTYVQQCRNAFFIFSGSQQHMMSEMFSSPSRPFYQSVTLMFLKPVDMSKYESFAKKHFEDNGKFLDKNVLQAIYNQFEGTTWYIQKMLNQLFAMTKTGEKVTLEEVVTAINMIVSLNEEAYKDTIYQLTTKQRDLLMAVGKEGKVNQMTGSRFIKTHHLVSASSVQKAAGVLMSKQLLTHHQGTYEVYDKFMSIWLRGL